MVEQTMTVPIWPAPDLWEGFEAISMNSNYPNEVAFIHVPPDSVATNDYGTFDKYITNFTIGGSTGKVLYVLMPPGGKLTRIYSQNAGQPQFCERHENCGGLCKRRTRF